MAKMMRIQMTCQVQDDAKPKEVADYLEIVLELPGETTPFIAVEEVTAIETDSPVPSS